MGFSARAFYRQHLHWRWVRWQTGQHIRRLARQVAQRCPSPDPAAGPVVFFNASTRLTGVSLNAAFALLAGWSLRLQGVTVVNFACQAGMALCPLGTNRDHPLDSPPCRSCQAQTAALTAHAAVRPLVMDSDPELQQLVDRLKVPELEVLSYQDLPLGVLVLPTVRWVLRRHHLEDDAATRAIYRRYLTSAWRVARQFDALLDECRPSRVVVFNGMFFPEATARHVARARRIPVITHEVGVQPFSAFFTPDEATAYPVDIPPDFELSPSQAARLDHYLTQRFKGDFSTAGIRFWPEMNQLSPELVDKISQFQQVVPVFTNVIFDTSQPHSNVIFPHMFAWLDLVLELIRAHPQTLFVIRAHPDEMRSGKESCESVRAWVVANGAASLPNVVFVDATEYLSSYELIQRAKFVMIYNSTIGLEATLFGVPVLCGGRARYTQYPTVVMPASPRQYRQQAEEMLAAEKLFVPGEFIANARRFLHYLLYVTSLPFNEFLTEDQVWRGFVRLKPFEWQQLLPENAPVLKVILDGILHGQPFEMEESG